MVKFEEKGRDVGQGWTRFERYERMWGAWLKIYFQ
jgi:hypothetical protein